MQELPRKSSRLTPACHAPWIVLERDGEVLVEELRGIGAVRVDPADLRRGDDRDVGLLGGEERLDGRGARRGRAPALPQDQLEPRAPSRTGARAPSPPSPGGLR